MRSRTTAAHHTLLSTRNTLPQSATGTDDASKFSTIPDVAFFYLIVCAVEEISTVNRASFSNNGLHIVSLEM